MSQKYDPAKGLIITQTRAVVKAISAAPGVATSEKATSEMTFVSAERPSFSPDGGLFFDPVMVAITSGTTGAKIYYTLDGTEPSPEDDNFINYGKSSDVFAFPFRLDRTDTVIKAIAMHPQAMLTRSEIESSD